MVVLGQSVAGVSGYSSDKEGPKDATFLPELLKNRFQYQYEDYDWQSAVSLR